MENIRVEKAWGNLEVVREGENFKALILEVERGCQLTKHWHDHRHETWIIVEGRGRVLVGERELIHGSGDIVRIPRGEVHRVENVGEELLIIMELQRGEYLRDDDFHEVVDRWVVE